MLCVFSWCHEAPHGYDQEGLNGSGDAPDPQTAFWKSLAQQILTNEEHKVLPEPSWSLAG